ncbi:DNA-directed DNA polymerase gamma mip1 [Orbilia brochopaga]|uniref:DNA-directed DNA polymerase n=1 Tax=Orbilia brochopaga TaxID=3140254 RepID=A0AAV9UW07_9PEZI
MQRIWRLSRVAPRQPTFPLVSPHLPRRLLPQSRWLATTAPRSLGRKYSAQKAAPPPVTTPSNESAALLPDARSPDVLPPDTIAPTAATPNTGLSPQIPAEILPLDTAASTAPASKSELLPATTELVPPEQPKPQARFNEIDVQHISDQLHSQIFGLNSSSPPEELVELARQHLTLHELLGKQSAPTDPIGFQLPKLIGNSLDEHFSKLGLFTAEPWRDLATRFAYTAAPPPPKEWNMETSGWTKYDRHGNATKDCPPSAEEMLVFDVEVLYKISPYPVIACALSPTAWYSWISPWVLGKSSSSKHLIPLGNPDQKRILVGHNVSYDRARIAEEYNMKQTGTFFLDTMSLHAAVNGMCSRQRPTWIKHRKNKELKEKLSEGVDPQLSAMVEQAASELETELWIENSSINSLRDVAHFHCNITISKETRDMMSEMTDPQQLKAKLRQCLDYCAADVRVTHEVYKKVLPKFLETCPHPVSFSALRHMGTLLLPVNSSWTNYINTSEKTYEDLLRKVRDHLVSLAEQTAAISFGGEQEKEKAADGQMATVAAAVQEEQAAYLKLVAEEKEVLKDEKWLAKIQKKARTSIKKGLEKTCMVQKKGKSTKKAADTSTLTIVTQSEFDEMIDERLFPEVEKMVMEERKLEEEKKRQKAEQKRLKAEQKRLGAAQKLKTHASSEDAPAETVVEAEVPEDMEPIRVRLATTEAIETTKQELAEKKAAALEKIAKLEKSLSLEQQASTRSSESGDKLVAEINKNPWSPENAWISQLDWSGREIKYKKQKKPTDPLVPVARQKLPGYPNWYRDLFKTGALMNISVRTRVAPLMLRLQWDGYPLVWTDKYGWTFRVPNKDIDKYQNTPMVRCDSLAEEPNQHVALDEDAVYFKLPHNGNGTTRCVNPLAKGYQRYFEDGVLTSEFAQAKEALDMNAACSYWISARERIKSQFVVWEHSKKTEGHNDALTVEGAQGMQIAESTENVQPSEEGKNRLEGVAAPLDMGFKKGGLTGAEETPGAPDDLGLILPQIVTMGTITRRAVENTWLTASNAKVNRVGSELKAMIKAPPGYCFVGADVDSEELWIASLIGDAEFKMHGGNAIGFMTLEGSKAEGTDMHSRTAGVLGISRNNAKVFNYGRIYGAGLKFAASLLRQFNPNVSEQEANVIAGNLYKVTKGTKTLRKVLRDQAFWRGGTESFVFNKLEEFAEQEHPRTPVLAAGITQALQKRNINRGEFLTSRINWAIQSSGVDYLHLLIVSMDYLIQQYNLKARLMITVHDEIRYIVKEEDKYKVAMALQVANLWTRAMFAQQMGINDLPQSCAFFSAVDIDHVLRKEVDLDCVTPSNPTPIAPGESLDIISLLEKPQDQLLPLGFEATKPTEIDKKYDYTPRVPVLERLSDESNSNIYVMKAQIAKTDVELNKVLAELRTEAPELMRSTLTRGRKPIHEIGAWDDSESNPFDYLNMRGRPLVHTPQRGYGWDEVSEYYEAPVPTRPAATNTRPRRDRALKFATAMT